MVLRAGAAAAAVAEVVIVREQEAFAEAAKAVANRASIFVMSEGRLRSRVRCSWVQDESTVGGIVCEETLARRFGTRTLSSCFLGKKSC